jgi:hypothetical protein
VVLDSKGQERKTFLIGIKRGTFTASRFGWGTPLCGMLLAPAQIRHDLQRSGIKPDGIINFLSNEPPIEQGAV